MQLIVGAVPSLDRYRPRLFSNVKEICAALSSHALPKLKWRFQKNSEGLLIQGRRDSSMLSICLFLQTD